MSIEEIRVRRGKIDGAPWQYQKAGQMVFGHSPGGCNMTPSEYRVADIRGWGHLQYKGDVRGDEKAEAMQDANGEFIARAPQDVDELLAEIDRLTAMLPVVERV